MMRCCMPLMLPGLLLVQCAPAGSVYSVPRAEKARIQTAAEPLVYSLPVLQACFIAGVQRAQNPINFRLEGELKSNWRKLVSESLWGEFARRCTTAFMETGQVSLTLEYRDYVRLRAAWRYPDIRASLTPDEEEVLRLCQERVEGVLKPGMSDYEKLLALHDSLVHHARYHESGGGDVRDILCGASGSCEAYSSTLCLMLELAGITSRVVTGTADGPHAWNLVKLDDKWYHVDATWNDPIIANGGREVVSHAYFCLSDAEIARTHSWNRDLYPATASQSAYYYRKSGIYFTDFASFWKAAMAAYRSGKPRFEGYLTTYGSASEFQRQAQKYMSAGTPAHLSWTGPETSAGAVILSW